MQNIVRSSDKTNFSQYTAAEIELDNAQEYRFQCQHYAVVGWQVMEIQFPSEQGKVSVLVQ